MAGRIRLSAALAAGVAVALPSAASAGTISAHPEVHTTTFLAAPGERNDVGHSVADGLARFTDAGAPLIVGDHCEREGLDALCATLPFLVARLGDRDDRADIGSISADVEGGDGDDVLTFGDGAFVDARGGRGADTIRVAAAFGAVYGDEGDDRLDGAWRVTGGEGDDTLTASVAGWLSGGPGADRLVAARGGDAALAGGPGDDLLYDRSDPSFPGWIRVGGSSGDDVIDGGAALGETVDAGPGDDRVHGWGAGTGSTFACGPGNDIAYVDAAEMAAEDCETVRQPPRDTLAALAERLAARRPGLGGGSAVRLLDQALAQIRAARAEACYESGLRPDAAGKPCLTALVAAVRRLAQVPALATETAELVAIERDLAVTRADEAAGLGAPAQALQRARHDIAAAAELGPVEASRRLERVWAWLAAL